MSEFGLISLRRLPSLLRSDYLTLTVNYQFSIINSQLSKSKLIAFSHHFQICIRHIRIAVLHLRHCPHKSDSFLSLSGDPRVHHDGACLMQSRQLAHPLHLGTGVVVVPGWCPSVDDVNHCPALVLLVVGVQQDERCPVPHLHLVEDAELAVVADLPLPWPVTLSDVQGVLVPDTPWELFCCCLLHDEIRLERLISLMFVNSLPLYSRGENEMVRFSSAWLSISSWSCFT